MDLDHQPPRNVSEYAEFPVPAPLADRFLCFWTQTITGSQGVYQQRVLPDACIDIVLIDDQSPVLAGPWTIPFVAGLAAGTTITGARLRPGRASCLLGIPASELLNQIVPIAELEGVVQAMRLERVMEQPNAAARRSFLGHALFTSMQPPPLRPCRPGRYPVAFAPSARPYCGAEPLDRGKRASASSALFGCCWLWSKDVSVRPAFSAPAQDSARYSTQPGRSRRDCRLC